MVKMGVPEDVPIENGLVSRSIESAQKRVEGHNFDIRKYLVEYDDVMNKQREVIYKRRDNILATAKNEPQKLKETILEMVEDEIEQVVSFHTAAESSSEWNLPEISEVMGTIFPLTPEIKSYLANINQESSGRANEASVKTELIVYLVEMARQTYAKLESAVAAAGGKPEDMHQIEKEILLRSIDNLWVEHLEAIDSLRAGIGLRGYGQRDPLIEYKNEARGLFIELLNLIQKQVVYSIFKIGLASNLGRSVMESSNLQVSAPAKEGDAQFRNLSADPFASEQRKESAVSKKVYDETGHKVGRNDPCPCGSGKKYKKCHGS
jgi:preprotein translocase subunit SecA